MFDETTAEPEGIPETPQPSEEPVEEDAPEEDAPEESSEEESG